MPIMSFFSVISNVVIVLRDWLNDINVHCMQ